MSPARAKTLLAELRAIKANMDACSARMDAINRDTKMPFRVRYRAAVLGEHAIEIAVKALSEEQQRPAI